MISRLALMLLLVLATASSGCTLMPHSLQPHQLWKLNRGPALGRGADAYFSIPDPAPRPPRAPTEG